MHRSFPLAAVAFFATGLLNGSAEAQEPRVRTLVSPQALAFTYSGGSNAVIGVGLATGSLGDTLGLSVTEVTIDSPAAKAGLEVGNRLTSINGVSLRISAVDANDPLTADAGYRRLQRELAKVKPGDAVTLQVAANGQSSTVTVTTTTASELNRSRATGSWNLSGGVRANRASLGIGIGSAGNARDTLGVFITSVSTDGPADKAGVIEGERIASINGVDVRVPREDVGVASAASARVSRLRRELDKVAPGDPVTLRVYANGRYRDVTVTAGKASDVETSVYRFESGGPVMEIRGLMEDAFRERGVRAAPTPPTPSVAPTRPAPPRRGAASTRL